MAKVKVKKVIDGDTFEAPRKKFYRLAEVNAPEKETKAGKKAKEYTQRALGERPRSPMPHFNLAFFALKDRIYKEALDEYKKIRINEKVNIIEIIAFLEKELEQYPDNLGFLFATGYLNFKYADEERGIEQLSDFLAQATKNKKFDYSPLIKEAKNLVEENKN